VWGIRDRVFVPAFLDQWQAIFPDSGKVELQAGHYLVEDAPDGVSDAIHEFVSGL
jgi:hypothetical protein